MHATVYAARAAAALAFALVCNTALAGRSCDAAKPPAPQMIEKGMTLAERTLKALDAEHAKNGTKVVVLARAGQDLSAYGLRYSHLGLAYRETQAPHDGRPAKAVWSAAISCRLRWMAHCCWKFTCTTASAP